MSSTTEDPRWREAAEEATKQLYKLAIMRRDECARAIFDAFAALRAEHAERRWRDAKVELPKFDVVCFVTTESNAPPLRACHAAEKEVSTDDFNYEGDAVYDEATDRYYWPAGWYEWNQHEDTHWRVTEGEVRWWMPVSALPSPPVAGKETRE